MRERDRVFQNLGAGLGVIAPFPVITALIFYYVMRIFRVRWYWPLGAAVIGGILAAVRPSMAIVSGSGYFWYLIFGWIFRHAPKGLKSLGHPMQIQMPGTAPMILDPSPFHWSRWHFPSFASLPEYFVVWKVVYSVLALMLLFGGLVAFVAALLRPPVILTSEERQVNQKRAGNGWTDFLVQRAEERERRKRRGDRS